MRFACKFLPQVVTALQSHCCLAGVGLQSSTGHGINWLGFFAIFKTTGKMWGLHGVGYEESHLLGFKIPVRTSQETHYVSTTESSQLMLCKIWGLHGGDYEECRLLGYKNPVHTSQETHYVSATESSQLMLCKIWGSHGGDYEECCLLGYKNSVRTSQETRYVSTTQTSRLMLCKIWGTLRRSCKNRRFGSMYRLHHQSDNNRQARKNVSSFQQPKYPAKKYVTLCWRRYVPPIRRFLQDPYGITSKKTAFFKTNAFNLWYAYPLRGSESLVIWTAFIDRNWNSKY
jgi:hypothetical protein